MAKKKTTLVGVARVAGWEDNDHLPADEVFDTRTLNCLTRAGVRHLGDLRGKTARELLGIRGWGRKTLLAVQDALDELELPPLREGE